MLLPDFSHLEPFISTRSLIWGDFSIPVCGLACLESSLLAPDAIHLGFPLSPQGASYLGSLVFVPDSIHAGFLSLLRGYSQPELASSVLDFLHLDSPLLLQASGYMDSSTFAFSEIRLEACLLLWILLLWDRFHLYAELLDWDPVYLCQTPLTQDHPF